MKKIFTLVAAALMAVGVNAQTVDELTFGGNTWNMGVPCENFTLKSNSAWGELLLTGGQAVDLSEYKGCKIEYANCTGTEPTYQLAIEGDYAGYVDLLPTEDSKTVTFGVASGSVTKLNLQAKEKDATITVKAFYLIKNDDTQVLQTLPSISWGLNIVNTVPGSLVFNGQYGSQEVQLASDGSKCTFDATDTESAHVFTFEFANDITAIDLMFELDNAANQYGFAYIHTGGADFANNPSWAEVTSNKVTFTIDAEVLGGQNVENVMFKASAADGYPFTAQILSATRTVTKVTAIKGINVDNNISNGAMYNLAGQMVDKSYKGIVIQNGKKFFNK
ncbi:MAG: hypothetical protein ACI4A7_02895 [Prevotella sp.]